MSDVTPTPGGLTGAEKFKNFLRDYSLEMICVGEKQTDAGPEKVFSLAKAARQLGYGLAGFFISRKTAIGPKSKALIKKNKNKKEEKGGQISSLRNLGGDQ